MKKYRITKLILQYTREEVVIISAKDTREAKALVLNGEGRMVDFTQFEEDSWTEEQISKVERIDDEQRHVG